MESPLFYTPYISEGLLPESEAYHVAKVLRARPGMMIMVTDGKGTLQHATLREVSSKRVSFQASGTVQASPRPYKVRIAVAPTRKPERNEWMLEKLVEFGVDEVWFIKTAHTHLESFGRVVNQDRMEKIAIAAMKQSGQFFLPEIRTGIPLNELLKHPPGTARFIAYVPEKASAVHLATASSGSADTLVLIGPEGDFTKEEVQAALSSGFGMVSLGPTRLRTETAAIAACHAVHLGQL